MYSWKGNIIWYYNVADFIASYGNVFMLLAIKTKFVDKINYLKMLFFWFDEFSSIPDLFFEFITVTSKSLDSEFSCKMIWITVSPTKINSFFLKDFVKLLFLLLE